MQLGQCDHRKINSPPNAIPCHANGKFLSHRTDQDCLFELWQVYLGGTRVNKVKKFRERKFT